MRSSTSMGGLGVSRPDVALVSPYPPPGPRHAGNSGVASYTANLAHALRDAGAKVTVVAPSEGGVPPVVDEDGVRVERPFTRGARALPAAARAAIRTGAPTVHLQHELFLYGGPASLTGLGEALGRLRRSSARSVVTCHQVVDHRRVDRSFTDLHRVRVPVSVARGGLAAVQGLIGRLADVVVVHEQAFADTLGCARVVPHGVEVVEPLAADHARTWLGLAPDRLVVLCFGFIAPYKGFESALDAAGEAGDGVDLVVAGGEHPRLAAAGDTYARDLARRYGSVARFTGFVPGEDVPRWFSGADLALLPYPRPFSASGALALALAYGLPVLLSPEMAEAMGAPASISATPAELGERLAKLAADRSGLDPMRQVSAQIASERSWPAVARQHMLLYEGV